MTDKNLMMTFELGRIKTWRLPAFSALLMLLRASLRTEVLTMMAVLVVDGDSQVRVRTEELEVSTVEQVSLQKPRARKSAQSRVLQLVSQKMSVSRKPGLRPGNATHQALAVGIAHLRLAEGGP
jgi:hypothetical protein